MNAKSDEMEMKFRDKVEQHKTEIDRLTFQHATKLARHEELLEEEIQNRAKISKLESTMEEMRAEHQRREEVRSMMKPKVGELSSKFQNCKRIYVRIIHYLYFRASRFV